GRSVGPGRGPSPVPASAIRTRRATAPGRAPGTRRSTSMCARRHGSRSTGDDPGGRGVSHRGNPKAMSIDYPPTPPNGEGGRMADRMTERNDMVDAQLARRGVRDAHVLDAMRTLPREAFVDPGYEE